MESKHPVEIRVILYIYFFNISEACVNVQVFWLYFTFLRNMIRRGLLLYLYIYIYIFYESSYSTKIQTQQRRKVCISTSIRQGEQDMFGQTRLWVIQWNPTCIICEGPWSYSYLSLKTKTCSDSSMLGFSFVTQYAHIHLTKKNCHQFFFLIQ